jgi:hypothetical protein
MKRSSKPREAIRTTDSEIDFGIPLDSFHIAARLFALASAMVLSTSCRDEAPQGPYKTPERLKGAVEFALVHQDTNFFWSLHCWTNVTPDAERIHRILSTGLFENSSGDRYKFRSFGFRAPLDGDNVPKRVKGGSYSQWNIPIRAPSSIISTGEQSLRAFANRQNFLPMEDWAMGKPMRAIIC